MYPNQGEKARGKFYESHKNVLLFLCKINIALVAAECGLPGIRAEREDVRGGKIKLVVHAAIVRLFDARPEIENEAFKVLRAVELVDDRGHRLAGGGVEVALPALVLRSRWSVISSSSS